MENGCVGHADAGGAGDVREGSALVGAAGLLRAIAWVLVLAPIGDVVIGRDVVLLVFAAPVVLGPIALGVYELGLARSLRAGHRRVASGVVASLQGVALLALAAVTTTADFGEAEAFYRLFCVATLLLGALSLGVALLVLWGDGPGPRTRRKDLGMRPALWPWIVAAVVLLLLSLGGIATEAQASNAAVLGK